jgi:hypothetical protein
MRTALLRAAAPALCLIAAACSFTHNVERSSPRQPVEAGASSSARRGSASCSWVKVRSPNPASPRFYQALERVAVDSPNDGWALGRANIPQEGGAQRRILLHWDGQTWRPASDVFDRRASASAISASSPTNAWVVGSEGRHGVAEYWDGSRWTLSRLAVPDAKAWYLGSVDALAAEDAWAVGVKRLGERLSDGFGPLVEHWDGSRWSLVPTPALQPSVPGDIPYARLDAVAASGSSDVWAVGETSITAPAAVSDTLVEHWNGSRWTVAATPDVAAPRGLAFDHLFTVAVVSSTDVWAAGSYGSTDAMGGRGDHPLVLHWDGIRWTVTATSPPQHGPLRWSRLTGIAASGPTAVWVVGSAGSFTQARAIVGVWDGRRWTASGLSSVHGSVLSDVAVIPNGTEVWAVGSQIKSGPTQRTLIAVCR